MSYDDFVAGAESTLQTEANAIPDGTGDFQARHEKKQT